MMTRNRSYDDGSTNMNDQNGLMSQVAAKLKGLDEAATDPLDNASRMSNQFSRNSSVSPHNADITQQHSHLSIQAEGGCLLPSLTQLNSTKVSRNYRSKFSVYNTNQTQQNQATNLMSFDSDFHHKSQQSVESLGNSSSPEKRVLKIHRRGKSTMLNAYLENVAKSQQNLGVIKEEIFEGGNENKQVDDNRSRKSTGSK